VPKRQLDNRSARRRICVRQTLEENWNKVPMANIVAVHSGNHSFMFLWNITLSLAVIYLLLRRPAIMAVTHAVPTGASTIAMPCTATNSSWLLIFPWSTGALKHFLTSRRTSHRHRRENQDETSHLTGNNQEMVPEAVRGQNTFVVKIDESSVLAR